MSKVDTQGWKAFRVGDLFMCDTTLNIPSKNNLVDGNINYVTRSTVENGLSGFCGNLKSVNRGQCITIGAEGFVAFWQPDDFVAGNKVYALRHESLTEIRALFVCTALNVLSKDYSFANARVLDKIKQEVILLPATPDGQPDWTYMDAYMSEVLKKEEVFAEHLSSLTAEAVADGHKLDTSEWKAFRIGELFDVSRPKARSQSMYSDGVVPFVASGNADNGIVRYCQPMDDEDFDRGNCITVSPLDGSTFYQSIDFLGRGGAGSAIVILRTSCLNEINGLFLASVIRNSLVQFSYSNQLSSSSIMDCEIYLPVVSDGQPDWAWMEQYMQQQMDKAEALVEHLDAVWNS